ncbi:MAG: T9SS type A sorting domain-containing protein [Bacteroidetes bacterium]|nr:T9SS type A sorting domain-containing protein [Bacteroidota bacterium]
MKDVSGRIVYSSEMNAQEGENQSVIEVSQLSKGVYMVEVRSNSAKQQVRLVVQ